MDEEQSKLRRLNFPQKGIKLSTNGKSILTFGEPLVVFSRSGYEGIANDRQFKADYAGAELNTAIGLARLGFQVVFSAAVGDDPFGEFIIRELRAEGIDVRFVKIAPEYSTGIFFKTISGLDRDPRVDYYRSQSPMAFGQFSASDCLSIIKSGAIGWVHTTGITRMVSNSTRVETDHILKTSHEGNVVNSFDINIRLKLGDVSLWRQNLQEVMPLVTWLFMGDSEAKQLFEANDPLFVYEKIRSLGFKGRGLVIKQGANGSTAITEDGLYQEDAFPVIQVVDTVGAGDGYNAGFIAGIHAGWEIQQAMKLGSIIGAYAVSSHGDSSGYPSWRVVKKNLTQEIEVQR